jgi:predicted RecA/RadA family phage recombinase
MADNLVMKNGQYVSVAVGSTITANAPVVVGDLHGVAITDYSSVTGKASIDLGPAIYDLSVTGTSSSGSSAGEVGDPVYINPSTFALTLDATKKYFGNLMEALTAGATATVEVRVQQSPSAEGGVGELITLEQFKQDPIAVKKAGGGAPTGTAGDENLLYTGSNLFEYHILGTQTLVAPAISATGLDIGMDQTANDGVELTQGITARSPGVFTVGTSPAFYAKCKFSIADVSGTDDCAFGFRKLEAYQANIDDYDEMAALNVIAGAIYIETILNNASTTSTDTTNTWADAATKTLEVYVSAAGVVTYKIDGAAPSTTAAFTFDTGEVVIPFFYFLNDTDLAGAVNLISWEVGLQ